MARMITENKKKITEKRVLLFSGGMDSLIMSYLLNPDILLFCRHNNKYEFEELNHIRKIQPFLETDVVFNSSLDLGCFERDDAIIPSRNLFFILLAANYGETIYFGSVYGDRSSDKSVDFFKSSEIMLNSLYKKQHWCEEHKFQILAPYKNFTKTELVTTYLRQGGSIEALLSSYSCYSGEEKPCGQCKPCFRKWVALDNNNIPTHDYFVKSPRCSPWLSDIIPLLDGGYRGREDNDIKKALGIFNAK